MVVSIRVAVEGGWLSFKGIATSDQIEACYKLPHESSRAQYWSDTLGLQIPDGRGLIWTTMEE